MSFMAYFDFSITLQHTLYFPKGTYECVLLAVNKTERRLGIRREYYNGECRWNHWPLFSEAISNEDYCEAVEEHNSMVRRFYVQCSEAKRRPNKQRPEGITPYMAKNLFIGLRQLSVPPEKWTGDYYQARMQAVYDALRGRPSEGMEFDSAALTIEQARDVIVLFSQYLDTHDIRLEVCKGQDTLTNSYNEGYFWCEKCGAVDYDDLPYGFDTDNPRCYECSTGGE